jgi:hypothetical protein
MNNWAGQDLRDIARSKKGQQQSPGKPRVAKTRERYDDQQFQH